MNNILSETQTKKGIEVVRRVPNSHDWRRWDEETITYKAKIEQTIEKKGKTNAQLMKELKKFSGFAKDPKVWLIINII